MAMSYGGGQRGPSTTGIQTKMAQKEKPPS